LIPALKGRAKFITPLRAGLNRREICSPWCKPWDQRKTKGTPPAGQGLPFYCTASEALVGPQATL